MNGKEGAGPARGGAGWACHWCSAVTVPVARPPGGALPTDFECSSILGVWTCALCDPCTSAHVWGPVCGWGMLGPAGRSVGGGGTKGIVWVVLAQCSKGAIQLFFST